MRVFFRNTIKPLLLTTYVWCPIVLFIDKDWEAEWYISLTSYQKTYTTEVSSHFETYLSDLLYVMAYCIVYSRRLGGHVINVVDEWPQDLHHWGEFALWSLSFWPPLCEDLLSCLFTNTGRPRDKCRWSMTTILTLLRWVCTLKPIFLTSSVWWPIVLFIHEDWKATW